MWKYNEIPSSDELYHHGILGQKWGIRRYQNEDGSLTPAGRKRYGVGKSDAEAQSFVDRAEDLAEAKLTGYTKRMLSKSKNYDDSGQLTVKAANKWKKKVVNSINRQIKNIQLNDYTKIKAQYFSVEDTGDDISAKTKLVKPSIYDAGIRKKNRKSYRATKVLNKRYDSLVKSLNKDTKKANSVRSVMDQLIEVFPSSKSKK